MVLTANIGNNIIALAVYDSEGKKLVNTSIASDTKMTADQCAAEILKVFELYRLELTEVKGAIISSVVPQLTETVSSAIKHIAGRTPMQIGPGIKTGLNIRIDDPAELGGDIVSYSVAAVKKYTCPLIIVDMGTAITVSAIDRGETYQGCAIYPGMNLAFDALAAGAALLPHIPLLGAEKAIGKNSMDAMRSGLCFGTAALIDGLIDKMEAEIGKATVIITGQYDKGILDNCQREMVYDAGLLTDGLYEIYVKNTQRKNK